jgi:hypothetical protein
VTPGLEPAQSTAACAAAQREPSGADGLPRLIGGDLRANLLGFFAAVAEAGRSYTDADLDDLAPPAGFDVDAALAAVLESGGDYEEIYADGLLGNAPFRRAVLGCRDVVAVLLPAAAAALYDPEPAVRTAAAHAAGACRAALGDPARLERDLAERAARAGPGRAGRTCRSRPGHGRTRSGPPRAYLNDPYPGVGACAALAPALADDPAALADILTARADLGPFLRVLFTDRGSGPLSPAQSRFLAALVDNDDIWFTHEPWVAS